MSGNRSPLPPDPLKKCAVCLRARGSKRVGWTPATRDGKVIAWTCPDCPVWGQEPIRREVNGGRVRYLAVVSGWADQHGRRHQLKHARTGKRRQIKRRLPTLQAAREWVAETEAGLAAAKTGDYSDPSKFTVRMLCDAWLKVRAADVGPNGIRQVTHTGYASALSGVVMLLGDRLARDVTPGDIEACLRALAATGGVRGKPLAHRSVLYSLTALRQVGTYAVREGWLTSNPAALAKPPRARHVPRDDDTGRLRWSPDELVAFREHLTGYADGQRFAAEPWIHAGMLATLCGLRRSEVLGLDWKRVNLKTGAIEVAASRVKTGVGNRTAIGDVKAPNSLRTVQADVIHPGTKAALRALWLAQGRPKTGLVILDAAGQPVGPDTYSRRFRTLCAEAGVPALKSIHQTRHSLATAMEAAGVPMHEAAALLGHDVATYMRHYLSTDSAGAASAAVAAGRIFASRQ